MDIEYKGYKVMGDKTYGFKEIKPVGKGSVHLSLRGKYTTLAAARQAIDSYLDSKQVKDNGETD